MKLQIRWNFTQQIWNQDRKKYLASCHRNSRINNLSKSNHYCQLTWTTNRICWRISVILLHQISWKLAKIHDHRRTDRHSEGNSRIFATSRQNSPEKWRIIEIFYERISRKAVNTEEQKFSKNPLNSRFRRGNTKKVPHWRLTYVSSHPSFAHLTANTL